MFKLWRKKNQDRTNQPDAANAGAPQRSELGPEQGTELPDAGVDDAGHADAGGAGSEDGPRDKASLESEQLEPRILLSATWVHADTGDDISGPKALGQ